MGDAVTVIEAGQLRQWDDSQYLYPEHRLQTFIVLEVRSSEVFRSWWILMGGEVIWETEDIIELHSDPMMDPCKQIPPVV